MIPRAVVRDLHTGAEAARLMSLLMLVFSVARSWRRWPAASSIDAAGWRAVFWAVASRRARPGAVASRWRRRGRPRSARRAAWRARSRLRLLLRDSAFMGLTIVGALGIAAFFVYLSNSSFVLIDHYGLTPRQYSLAFAVNAASFIGVVAADGALTHRHGLRRVVTVAVAGFALAMCGLALLHLAGATAWAR